MVNCPKCGAEMMQRGIVRRTSEPVYRCDKCGINRYIPPKEVVKPPEEPKPTLEEPEEKIETTKKTGRKKKYEDEPPEY
ncbi:unnamed protein product [marine sediment metagenome]|uniref:Uncharacterized protein n=1 Tax=marine sediment metagenome TaxID=412755 RepID=X1NU07_9ZZZZ